MISPSIIIDEEVYTIEHIIEGKTVSSRHIILLKDDFLVNNLKKAT